MKINYNSTKRPVIFSRGEYFLLLIFPFIFMLNIPNISIGYLVFLMLFKIIKLLALKIQRMHKMFLLNLFLLFCFCAAYFMISYNYGFRTSYESIKYTLMILCSYGIGFSIYKKNTNNWPYGLIWITLSLVAGAVFLVFMSVYSVIGLTSNINVIGRVVPLFWQQDVELGGPAIGALASLGICIFPILVFTHWEDKVALSRSYNAILIIVTFLSVGGFYTNIATQNRTPFIALVVSFGLSSYVYFNSGNRIAKGKVFKLFFVATIVGLVYYAISENVSLLKQYAVYNRFLNERLESGRYDSWFRMIKAIFNGNSLMGGKVVSLKSTWVHNLWLDAVYETGIIPALFLLIFHLRHLKPISNLVHSKTPLLIRILFVNVIVSVFINFFQEPTLSANMVYFSSSCFFLGLVSRTSYELKYLK